MLITNRMVPPPREVRVRLLCDQVVNDGDGAKGQIVEISYPLYRYLKSCNQVELAPEVEPEVAPESEPEPEQDSKPRKRK